MCDDKSIDVNAGKTVVIVGDSTSYMDVLLDCYLETAITGSPCGEAIDLRRQLCDDFARGSIIAVIQEHYKQMSPTAFGWHEPFVSEYSDRIARQRRSLPRHGSPMFPWHREIKWRLSWKTTTTCQRDISARKRMDRVLSWGPKRINRFIPAIYGAVC